MKTKIFILIALATLSFQFSTFNCFSQTKQTLADTNIIFYDYIPDVVLYGSISQNDSLRIDLNQDGVLDFRFYYTTFPSPMYPFVGSLNSNVNSYLFSLTNTDSLNNPSINWHTGSDFWNPLDYPDVYWGIRITNGSNNYYGWIHALGGGTKAYTMTIDKYAFCKIPNYPFHVGQTTVSTGVPIIENPDSTNVYLSNTSIIVQSGKRIKNVTVTSANGVVVALQNNINSYSASISTAGIAHGTYIVQVQFNDLSVYTKQIVI
ncbi:MAG: T9SS type A sorting domain-containing protein [Bacteroidia bacterium]|nr:T9SS type A sorting domain-containing protein [Bacteroidia bacterium]